MTNSKEVGIVLDLDPELTKYKLNYKFQPADSRDIIYKVPNTTNITPHNTFSLASKITTIRDQGSLGSCVSNAFSQYFSMGTSNKVNISRLYHYYTGRLISGLSNLDDSGLYVRDACKIVSKAGACQETLWSYNVNNFAVMPPLACFQGSKFFQSYSYSSIPQTVTAITSFLDTQGKPVVFGLTVYDSFMTSTVSRTGIVPMPNTNNESVQGGHCMLIVGYDSNDQLFLCVNSWGNAWGCSSTGATTGSRGFCYLPYAYVTSTSLCNDFWGLSFVF